MTEALTQVGVGGIFAVILIREVLGFLAKRKNSQTVLAGEMPPEYWQAEQRKAITEVMVTTIVPLLANHQTILFNQTQILNEMRASHADLNRNMAVMLERFSK